MWLKRIVVRFITIILLVVSFYSEAARSIAEWTFLVYMQADNNLEPYAVMNVNQMQKGIYSDSSKVNVLVQWDQPNNNKTWRYKIVKGGKIDVGSLDTEMGIDPQQELIDCATWVKKYYPAKKYAFILWNHGSGIEDITRNNFFAHASDMWLELPGFPRGILYDDSQHTLLTNQALTNAFTHIKSILGQPVDLLGMDACMMAMLEVSYQLKGLVKVIAASEQVEPGSGYAYDAILNPLTKSPAAYDEKKLANLIVTTYATYNIAAKENDFTASAFDMNYIDLMKVNIDTFVLNVTACAKLNASQIKQAVITARKKSLTFYYVDYIDLYAFYSNMSNQVSILRKNSKTDAAYVAALDTLNKTISQGMTLISKAIVANSVGSEDSAAKGIAIYYLDPNRASSSIDASYLTTLFAQNSLWLNFVKQYRNVA